MNTGLSDHGAMNRLRSNILRDLFNIPYEDFLTSGREHATVAGPAAADDPSDLEAPLCSSTSGLLDDLRGIAERLDITCASSFNISTLSFIVDSQSLFRDIEPNVTDCERFLATLVPTATSSRLFLYKIRSLQALMVDLEALRLECSDFPSPSFRSECDNIMVCITTDLQKLLSSAWEFGQKQGQLATAYNSVGVHRFDYCKW
jgi:hypothetical protein